MLELTRGIGFRPMFVENHVSVAITFMLPHLLIFIILSLVIIH